MLATWADLSTFRADHRFLLLFYILSLLQSCLAGSVPGAAHISQLKQEAEDLFYHGFDNYMIHAFPEDELRPISCTPHTRDGADPSHIEVNDALGNYSLTLIDSLSTLAILASSPSEGSTRDPLSLFQHAVKDVIEQYGDGTSTPSGQGKRARGFDLDSKVQVFETTIRGLGGLLSAHLFAVGDLPIRDYNPAIHEVAQAKNWGRTHESQQDAGIQWSNGFVYDGQLLRLAYDLGLRLLPAFWTSTGIPYPRVNLKSGIPFYANSAENYDPQTGQCDAQGARSSVETTETCSAGAGSLVLEFAVLSRLTGDSRFEDLAKKAFWAVWSRRSDIDLVGAGIDAETGNWNHAWTGIGAGIDSFFEYAYKSHILLSGGDRRVDAKHYAQDPRQLHEPLTDYEQSSDAFLNVWDASHEAIKRHIHRGPNFQHDHYIQVDLATGAARAFWIDALSAYYPGLLALSGHVEEATATHLVYTALWTRFSGMPERYNMVTGGIEGGLGWWIGRPEFIESTWYLYRATEDPWYIYVGEMVLRDIERRCWTECGWAGIQNVLTGEKIDRMESFFLGETAKYLFLLFDPGHPLNNKDAPIVFSTEGHPLIIPRIHTGARHSSQETNDHTCQVPPHHKSFTLSQVAARNDLYHAASLARLHMTPRHEQAESASAAHGMTQYAGWSTNFTYFPWTLPQQMLPHDGMSTPMPTQPTFELTFPSMGNPSGSQAPLQRVQNGLLLNSISGLHLSMVQDVPRFGSEVYRSAYRIQSINNVALGKDEKVFVSRNMAHASLNPADPLFSRNRDAVMLDLVVEGHPVQRHEVIGSVNSSTQPSIQIEMPNLISFDSGVKTALTALMAQIQNLVKDTQNLLLASPQSVDPTDPQSLMRQLVPAVTATGLGAAPIPDWPDIASEIGAVPSVVGLTKDLPWTSVYATDILCNDPLKSSVPRTHQIILIKRGGCSFSKKLSNIPSVAPGPNSLQLVIVVDDEEGSAPSILLTRPSLEDRQTTPSGLLRPRGYPMVLVGGGESTYSMLRDAEAVGVRRRWSVSCQGVPIDNLIIV